jgi:hypothetical protein
MFRAAFREQARVTRAAAGWRQSFVLAHSAVY